MFIQFIGRLEKYFLCFVSSGNRFIKVIYVKDL